MLDQAPPVPSPEIAVPIPPRVEPALATAALAASEGRVGWLGCFEG